MKYIDEHYKDAHPIDTVENIIGILRNVGIEPVEKWNASGIDNCWSLVVSGSSGFPSSNGKGISKELARASAYGEFIERLQCGLFLYKYQSIMNNQHVQLHSYASDCKFVTFDELIADGDWMDYLINSYGHGLSRDKIAKQCLMYDCSNSDKILTVPYYSLFEDRYIHIPVGFAEQMYSANGCCAGNSKEEAWIHALAEIMERKGEISLITNGKSYPIIPDDILYSFPTVAKILDAIKETNNFEVTIFDISENCGFPVLATRIINKSTHDYLVNTAADPVFEIAIHRTLTEIFQGRNLNSFSSTHNSTILKSITDFSASHNVLNQLESGNGVFTYKFFMDDNNKFSDMSMLSTLKNNKDILLSILDRFKKLGVPVLVRNQSFLGFPCYKFIIPGFSETRALRLSESPQEFALGSDAAQFLRNPLGAPHSEIIFYLSYYNKIKSIFSRRNHYGRLSGIPLSGNVNYFLIHLVNSYAYYRINRYSDAIVHLKKCLKSEYIGKNDIEYFECVTKYLELVLQGFDLPIILGLLSKFYSDKPVLQLKNLLSSNKSPYDDYLPACDYSACGACKYSECCSFSEMVTITKSIGRKYGEFLSGQDRKEFLV